MLQDPAFRNSAIAFGLLIALGVGVMRQQRFATPPDDPWFQAIVIDRPGVVMVKFGAEWCPPCRAMHSSLQKLKARHGGNLRVVEIDVDKMPHLAQHYSISSIPRTMLFVNGEYQAGRGGASSADELDKWVQPYLNSASTAAR